MTASDIGKVYALKIHRVWQMRDNYVGITINEDNHICRKNGDELTPIGLDRGHVAYLLSVKGLKATMQRVLNFENGYYSYFTKQLLKDEVPR